MNIVFLGSGTFGIPALKAIHESKHNILGIVTPPNKLQGRGRKLVNSPIREWAQSNHVPVLPIINSNEPESLYILKELRADCFIVASFGTILSDKLLKIPPHECFNLHPSLLPKYRGASPIAQALVDGEEEVGTTIMRVVRALDAGDIVLQEKMKLKGDENAQEVTGMLSALSAKLMVKVLDSLGQDKISSLPQNADEATFCTKWTKADADIDWNWKAQDIHNRVRGLFPWPGTSCLMKGKRIKILKTSWTEDAPAQTRPGMVLIEETRNKLGIATGQGILWIHELQLEGKKPVKVQDFLNGNPIQEGLILNS